MFVILMHANVNDANANVHLNGSHIHYSPVLCPLPQFIFISMFFVKVTIIF